MRPVRVTVSAAGNSPWIPLDYLQNAFAVALAIIPWATVTGTPSFTAQHTFDETGKAGQGGDVSLARTTTTATVTDIGPDGNGHGLSTGDNVIIKGAGAPFDTLVAANGGDFGADITYVSNTTYTYVVANSGAATGSGKVTRLRVFNHGDSRLVTAAARVDGNYAFPPRMTRLKVTTMAAGAVDYEVIQGGPPA